MKKDDFTKMKALFIMAGLVAICGLSFATDSSSVDQTFVEKTTQDGLQEVEAARLVNSKTQNPQIINLANTLLNDHSTVNNDLAIKAGSASLKIPNAMSPLGQSQYDRLNKLVGEDFERQYLQNEITNHENSIQLFKFEASNGKNTALRNFASNTLPTLQNHLEMTRRVLSNISGQ